MYFIIIFLQIFYLNAAFYLPEQYNDIMNILYEKEIRLYLPIQELNVILEPIRGPEEMNLNVEDENEVNDNTSKDDNNESSISG